MIHDTRKARQAAAGGLQTRERGIGVVTREFLRQQLLMTYRIVTDHDPDQSLAEHSETANAVSRRLSSSSFHPLSIGTSHWVYYARQFPCCPSSYGIALLCTFTSAKDYLDTKEAVYGGL